MNAPAPLLRRWADITLLGVLLFTVAYFVFTHEGLYALDDYYYSRYAHQLVSGTFHLGPDPQRLLHDPLHERWLIFGPVALCYALFGVNIWSTTLWPLVATLACAVLIWRRYRHAQPVAASAAMLLLGLHYFALNLTNYLYPDNINMLACLVAVLVLNRARQLSTSPGAWGAAFAAANFAALLCKETIVYFLPFYVGLLVLDVARRQHLRFWLAAAVAGMGLLGAYLLFYQWQTDDALYRIHLIEQTNEFLKEGNFLLGNRQALLARITYGPLLFIIGTGLGFTLLLAVGSLLRKRESVADDRRFWLGLAFSTLACYWLGSTSLSQYNPITLQPRMLTPLLPPLCLAAGYGLQDVLQRGRGLWLYVLALLLLAALDRSSVAVLYVGWAGVLGVLAIGSFAGRMQAGTRRFVAFGLLGVAAVLAIRPAHFMLKPGVSAHFEQERIIRRHLRGPASTLVFVDDYLIGNYDFYYSYQVPSEVQYRRYWARDSVQVTNGQAAFLLLNRATLSNPELTRKLLRYSPDSVLSWYPQRRLVARDGPVELYQLSLKPQEKGGETNEP